MTTQVEINELIIKRLDDGLETDKMITTALEEQMEINKSFRERIAELERLVGLLVELVPIGEDIDA